ncbi:hypothetical protein [Pseudanabaena galeata]|jgi:hypothetical protein|uniref:hypothetical protein n=1 Tax=Pseudanabaena galeata TaxID=1112103 RepID=UPI002478C183|nr:hypothetical protein [Pseudanabaena galeata]WGS73867.1 hypothetical protein OA858_07510 [Pseudanabaena galeata CCNP1313]
MAVSKSHYETDFNVSSAFGTGNIKISFLKARRWMAFKKLIFIMQIAGCRLMYQDIKPKCK